MLVPQMEVLRVNRNLYVTNFNYIQKTSNNKLVLLPFLYDNEGEAAQGETAQERPRRWDSLRWDNKGEIAQGETMKVRQPKVRQPRWDNEGETA